MNRTSQRDFCWATYLLIVWLETLLAVDTKNERVHIEGIRLKLGYFSLNILEL
jgi:hypothetical protein